MRSFNQLFLRIFVALTVAMFIANTVYAAGMMLNATAKQTHHAAQQSQLVHTHSAQSHHHADLNIHQAQHQSVSNGGCSYCNHCLACYSIILHQAFIMADAAIQPVLVSSVVALYASPARPQLQKPPIA